MPDYYLETIVQHYLFETQVSGNPIQPEHNQEPRNSHNGPWTANLVATGTDDNKLCFLEICSDPFLSLIYSWFSGSSDGRGCLVSKPKDQAPEVVRTSSGQCAAVRRVIGLIIGKISGQSLINK